MRRKNISLPMKSGYYKRLKSLQYSVATHIIVTDKIFILKKDMKISKVYLYKFST